MVIGEVEVKWRGSVLGWREAVVIGMVTMGGLGERREELTFVAVVGIRSGRCRRNWGIMLDFLVSVKQQFKIPYVDSSINGPCVISSLPLLRAHHNHIQRRTIAFEHVEQHR